jgi:hypothetical protein
MELRSSTAIYSVLLLGLVPVTVQAQELPSEGSFSVTYIFVNPNPAKPVSTSQDREVVANNYISTTVNDAGSGLMHNMAGRCLSISAVDKKAKTVEIQGNCTYSDRSGDLVFEGYATPSPQPLSGPIKVSGKWLGGTGKYLGLTGEFDITNSGNLSTDGDYTQSAGKKAGSYKISK